MKIHEQELRAESQKGSLALVTASGERVNIRSRDHIFFPPLEDEYGNRLRDDQRSDFFDVWSDGRSHRFIAFAAINIIESSAPL